MKDFFKMLAASLLSICLVIGGLVFVFILFVALVSGKPSVKVPHGAMLVIELGVPISDKPSEKTPKDVIADAAFGRGSANINLRSVTEAIRRAAKDKNISGIYLTGNVVRVGYSSGWGALREIRDTLVQFRKSGKKVIAYNMAWDDASYYLATAADEIVVNPFGLMEMKGFAAQMMFFARAFEKYGIEVQVTRVGKYKSAVEPFLLDHMSEANREQYGKLLGDIWSTYLADVAAARQVNVADLQRFADERGLLRAPDMKAARLADKVMYFDDVLAELKKITGADDSEKTFRQVKLNDYIQAIEAQGSARPGKNRVAVIYAEGEIVDGDDHSQVGGDYIARLLRRAREDEHVKAVVLRVNSPGGSATASEVIQREIRLTKQAKPVIVSMGTVAASGGYWISAYGDRIFAEPGTLTGSIGVFGMFPNAQKLVNNIGINIDTVKTGKLADVGSAVRSKTPEELAIFQQEVDWVYGEFVGKVVEGRKLPRAKVEEIAQGRVWSGAEAKNLGLVDEMGGLEDAILFAVKKADLGDKYGLTFYQEKKSTLQQLLSSMGDEDRELAQDSAMLREARAIMTDLHRIATLNDPHGVYARLPFDPAQ